MGQVEDVEIRVVRGGIERSSQEQDLLDAIRALFHEVLVREPGWRWPDDDAVDLGEQPGREGLMLVDRYDDVSDVICMMRDGKIIAAHRMTPRAAHDRRLPVECYGAVLPERFHGDDTVELAHLVVTKAYRGSRKVFELLAAEFRWLQARGVRWVVTTSACPRPCLLYRRLGMACEGLLLYPGDDAPVCLLSGDVTTAQQSPLFAVVARGHAGALDRAA